MHLALVVHPRHTENDLTFGFADTLHDRGVQQIRMASHHGTQRLEDLVHSLVELGLTRVARRDDLPDGDQFLVHVSPALLKGLRLPLNRGVNRGCGAGNPSEWTADHSDGDARPREVG